MSANFKTCMFGGFDRRDVVAYIEKTAKENARETEALTHRCDALLDENSRLNRQLEILRRQIAAHEEAEKTHRALEQRAQALEEENGHLRTACDGLQTENDTLRQQAEEYARIRDHIAEIEISAHRRTEEFRAQTVQRMQEQLSRQQQWCAESRAQYRALLDDFCEKLESARAALAQTDLSGFEDVAGRLQALSDELNADKN